MYLADFYNNDSEISLPKFKRFHKHSRAVTTFRQLPLDKVILLIRKLQCYESIESLNKQYFRYLRILFLSPNWPRDIKYLYTNLNIKYSHRFIFFWLKHIRVERNGGISGRGGFMLETSKVQQIWHS